MRQLGLGGHKCAMRLPSIASSNAGQSYHLPLSLHPLIRLFPASGLWSFRLMLTSYNTIEIKHLELLVDKLTSQTPVLATLANAFVIC